MRSYLVPILAILLLALCASETNEQELFTSGGELEKLISTEAIASINNNAIQIASDAIGLAPKKQVQCEGGLYMYMDNLAVKLKNAISNHQNAQEMLHELKDAINMADLIKVASGASSLVQIDFQTTKYESIEKPTKGLLDLLNDNNIEKNEHIVHANRKISEKAFEEFRQFAKSGLEIPIEKYMQFYSDPRWNKEYRHDKSGKLAALSEKIQSAKNSIIHNFEISVGVMDRLYASSAFLEQIPLIGQQITALRAKGQGLYDILTTVRSLKTLVDVYKTGKKLDVKLTPEAKKMISKTGIEALKYAATSLIKHFLGEQTNNPVNISEIAGRMAYYLLIQFAPHVEKCN